MYSEQPSSSPETARTTAESDLERALAECYRALGRRDHTVSRLRSRLVRAGVEEGAIEEALAIVAEQGYLDDARYAQRLAEDRRELDGWGSERIRARLAADGVERELIDRTLAERTREDELEAAVALLATRFATIAGDQDRGRAWNMLVRRGYEPELAYESVREFERSRRGQA